MFTGVLALVGAGLWAKGWRLAARIVVGIAIVLVLGFFGSKTASGEYDLNLRIGLTMALSVLEIVVLAWPVRAKADPP